MADHKDILDTPLEGVATEGRLKSVLRRSLKVAAVSLLFQGALVIFYVYYWIGGLQQDVFAEGIVVVSGMLGTIISLFFGIHQYLDNEAMGFVKTLANTVLNYLVFVLVTIVWPIVIYFWAGWAKELTEAWVMVYYYYAVSLLPVAVISIITLLVMRSQLK